jgi:sugar/nucleoside kinase (ribokinase family)
LLNRIARQAQNNSAITSRRKLSDNMSIVAVGAVAYDTIETPHGTVTGALGGSLSYFALGARFFGPVSIIAAVGDDFRDEDRRLFAERGIDTRALVHRPGKTFHWHGRYHEDMNIRDSLATELGVFGDFMPELLPDQRRADFVFLANISPQLQEHVLSQVLNPRLVAADTIKFYIENDLPGFVRLMPRIQILTVNDEEARLLTGEHNLVKAGRAILKMGARIALVKRGEYGVLQFSPDSMFAVPAWPLEEVLDPTGAGDAFAAGVMGWLARSGRMNESILRTAVVYGSVMGSFVVEKFSVARLLALTWEDIEQRYRAFIQLTDSHYSRWMSQ